MTFGYCFSHSSQCHDTSRPQKLNGKVSLCSEARLLQPAESAALLSVPHGREGTIARWPRGGLRGAE